jgi:hypothetical protein
MKDLNLERFPQLCKMQIVQKDSIWSFIDCDTCEFLHILPVLNVKQFRECSKPQKSQYLKRIAWIVIRSLLVPGTTRFYVDRYFAVSTTGCFMLHQKDSVNVKSCEVTKIKIDEIQMFLKNRFQVSKIMLAEITLLGQQLWSSCEWVG